MTSNSSQPSLILARYSVPTNRRPHPSLPAPWADGDHEHAHRLAGAGRQDDGAAHDLIGVARVDAETDGDFDGFVELRKRHLLDELEGGLLRIVGGADLAALTRPRYFLPCVCIISPSPPRPSTVRRRRSWPLRCRRSHS
jgi:hypothetical protein